MSDFHLLFLLRALLLTANAQENRSTIEVPVGLPLLLKTKGKVRIYEYVNGSWAFQAPAADLDEQRKVIGRHIDASARSRSHTLRAMYSFMGKLDDPSAIMRS
jgi:hypothetical protein